MERIQQRLEDLRDGRLLIERDSQSRELPPGLRIVRTQRLCNLGGGYQRSELQSIGFGVQAETVRYR